MSQTNPSNAPIILMGEAMLELRQGENGVMHQSFAGDAFNSAVYLKRSFPNTAVSFMTALGSDNISAQMRDVFSREQLQLDNVFTANDRHPGIYLVQTDEQGERSFLYWREQSAAKQIMQLIKDADISRLQQAQMLFFSGITLAVIQSQQRPLFWKMLEQLKAAGVKIVFDPNYRQRLWIDKNEATEQFELAFAACDMMLPGIEDFSALYGINSAESLREFLQPFSVDEIVIKDGANGVMVVTNGETQFFEIEPVINVVDTTSAGDAFNGVYLGARLQGQNIQRAVLSAAKTAGFVIQHPGAIVPMTPFEEFVQASREAAI